MAKQTKYIIKVSDGGSLAKLLKDAGKLDSTLRGSTSSAGRAYDTISNSANKLKRAQDGVSNSSLSTAKAFSKQQQGLGGLVRAYATIAANVFALTAAFNFLGESFRNLQIEKTADILSNKLGVSLNSVSKQLIEISGYALNFSEALKLTSSAAIAGINSDNLKQLTEIATAASRVLGRDLNDSMNRIIRGTAKLETEILDELGIFVKLGDATKAYADELGVAVTSLTDFQRRQAFLNAVVKSGNNAYSEVIQQLKEMENGFEKLSAAANDLIQSVVKPIAGVVGEVLSFISENTIALGALLGFIGLRILKQFANPLQAGLLKINKALLDMSSAAGLAATGLQRASEQVVAVNTVADKRAFQTASLTVDDASGRRTGTGKRLKQIAQKESAIGISRRKLLKDIKKLEGELARVQSGSLSISNNRRKALEDTRDVLKEIVEEEREYRGSLSTRTAPRAEALKRSVEDAKRAQAIIASSLGQNVSQAQADRISSLISQDSGVAKLFGRELITQESVDNARHIAKLAEETKTYGEKFSASLETALDAAVIDEDTGSKLSKGIIKNLKRAIKDAQKAVASGLAEAEYARDTATTDQARLQAERRIEILAQRRNTLESQYNTMREAGIATGRRRVQLLARAKQEQQEINRLAAEEERIRRATADQAGGGLDRQNRRIGLLSRIPGLGRVISGVSRLAGAFSRLVGIFFALQGWLAILAPLLVPIGAWVWNTLKPAKVLGDTFDNLSDKLKILGKTSKEYAELGTEGGVDQLVSRARAQGVALQEVYSVLEKARTNIVKSRGLLSQKEIQGVLKNLKKIASDDEEITARIKILSASSNITDEDLTELIADMQKGNAKLQAEVDIIASTASLNERQSKLKKDMEEKLKQENPFSNLVEGFDIALGRLNKLSFESATDITTARLADIRNNLDELDNLFIVVNGEVVNFKDALGDIGNDTFLSESIAKLAELQREVEGTQALVVKNKADLDKAMSSNVSYGQTGAGNFSVELAKSKKTLEQINEKWEQAKEELAEVIQNSIGFVGSLEDARVELERMVGLVARMDTLGGLAGLVDADISYITKYVDALIANNELLQAEAKQNIASLNKELEDAKAAGRPSAELEGISQKILEEQDRLLLLQQEITLRTAKVAEDSYRKRLAGALKSEKIIKAQNELTRKQLELTKIEREEGKDSEKYIDKRAELVSAEEALRAAQEKAYDRIIDQILENIKKLKEAAEPNSALITSLNLLVDALNSEKLAISVQPSSAGTSSSTRTPNYLEAPFKELVSVMEKSIERLEKFGIQTGIATEELSKLEYFAALEELRSQRDAIAERVPKDDEGKQLQKDIIEVYDNTIKAYKENARHIIDNTAALKDLENATKRAEEQNTFLGAVDKYFSIGNDQSFSRMIEANKLTQENLASRKEVLQFISKTVAEVGQYLKKEKEKEKNKDKETDKETDKKKENMENLSILQALQRALDREGKEAFGESRRAALGELGDVIKEIIEGTLNGKTEITEADRTKLTDSLKRAAIAAESMRKVAEQIEKASTRMADVFSNVSGAENTQEFGALNSAVATGTEGFGTFLAGLHSEDQEKQTEGINKMSQAFKGLADSVGEVSPALAGLYNGLSQLGPLFDSQATSAEKFGAVTQATLSVVSGLMQQSAMDSIAAIDEQIAAEKKRDGKSKESQKKIYQLELKKFKETQEMKKKMAYMDFGSFMISAAVAAMSTAAAAGPFAPLVFAAVFSAFTALGVATLAATLKSINSASPPSPPDAGSAVSNGLAIGKRSSSVDVARSATGGEAAYLRGSAGTGTNANNFTPRAEGGPVSPYASYLVGERGPELFVPESAGTIQNNSTTNNSTSANFTVNAVDASGFENMLFKNREALIGMLREAAHEKGSSFMGE